MFHVLETDDLLMEVARRMGEETVARIRARVAPTTLPARQLDPLIRLLLECLNHTFGITGMLRMLTANGYEREFEAGPLELYRRR